jgi:branched-chain amino acid transport system permease protein
MSHTSIGRALIAVQILLLAAPLLVAMLTSDNFIHDSLTQVLIGGVLALAWNILGGYARQISIGHVAFFGIGAYTSTLLRIGFDLSPWLGMLAGGLLAALAGTLLGLITFRLRGPFFTMATIAFAEVLRILAVNLRGLTRGSEGLALDSTPDATMFVFGSLRTYVVVAWAMMVGVFLVSWLLGRSKMGLRLLAFREDETAARSLGVSTYKLRLFAMGLSAFFTAVAGTLYAQYLLFIDPDSVFGVDTSLQMALASVVGGIGSAIGPILGTYLIIPFGQVLRAQLGAQLAGLHLIVYGLGLIVVLWKMPDGVWPALERWLRRLVAGRTVDASYKRVSV